MRVAGEDWRAFLQGLITQDVETLAPGELRFGALLTPQGRLLYDLFLLGEADGVLARLRRRARDGADRPADDLSAAGQGGDRAIRQRRSSPAGERTAPPPPLASPIPACRSSASAPMRARRGGGGADYDAHRLASACPPPSDFGADATYPIEANFDLLNGIDFKKGCFVGQETTSRMKRRGTIKSRMAPVAWEGDAARARRDADGGRAAGRETSSRSARTGRWPCCASTGWKGTIPATPGVGGGP